MSAQQRSAIEVRERKYQIVSLLDINDGKSEKWDKTHWFCDDMNECNQKTDRSYA